MPKKFLLILGATLGCIGCTPPELTEREASFQEVSPILAERCGADGCHGNPANGNFMIPGGVGATQSQVRDALEGMNTSQQVPLIEPDSPQDSAIYQRLVAEPPALMPPNDPLSDRDIELIRRWIRDGAPYE